VAREYKQQEEKHRDDRHVLKVGLEQATPTMVWSKVITVGASSFKTKHMSCIYYAININIKMEFYFYETIIGISNIECINSIYI